DSTNDCVQDCNDEWGGSAEYDDCTNPVCAGGSTGLIANDTCTDCNGEVNGSATYDECGVCNGSGPSGECGCNDILDGYCDCDENILDECGFCGGDNSTCLDCSGTANGEAQKDMCGVCDSDITNDCIQDCNDEWGGSAEYDDCINPVCAGGSTGLIANATCTDCNGDVNGSAIIDCSGECDGIAFSDMCGTCDTDSTNDCTLDCTGEWGGSLVNDDCGWCGGDGCHGGDCETYPADKYDCDGVLLANDLFAPFEFKLLPNYPNPFNPSTTINYSVAIYSEVNISIYSMAGELVQTLVNTTQQPGQYAIQWNASNFPSGLYFVKLNSNNKIAEQKVLLIK
ncbi:MAG: T9SS type A sorting domain-containing protein, partial [Candidatus Marinimicrobia bacterium]|nr:T9SS type A sorting domain-containing protein [Candidatus Neomarinimicrobiota bacterium]